MARAGFLYQDHIGARFCIEMLRNAKLAGVWCETLDDITLIWNEAGQAIVEFVQVKSNVLAQMWSVALLCGGGEESIVARSLAQHRCHEPCCFRIPGLLFGRIDARLEETAGPDRSSRGSNDPAPLRSLG
jgi:hypothetical protein